MPSVYLNIMVLVCLFDISPDRPSIAWMTGRSLDHIRPAQALDPDVKVIDLGYESPERTREKRRKMAIREQQRLERRAKLAIPTVADLFRQVTEREFDKNIPLPQELLTKRTREQTEMYSYESVARQRHSQRRILELFEEWESRRHPLFTGPGGSKIKLETFTKPHIKPTIDTNHISEYDEQTKKQQAIYEKSMKEFHTYELLLRRAQLISGRPVTITQADPQSPTSQTIEQTEEDDELDHPIARDVNTHILESDYITDRINTIMDRQVKRRQQLRKEMKLKGLELPIDNEWMSDVEEDVDIEIPSEEAKQELPNELFIRWARYKQLSKQPLKHDHNEENKNPQHSTTSGNRK